MNEKSDLKYRGPYSQRIVSLNVAPSDAIQRKHIDLSGNALPSLPLPLCHDPSTQLPSQNSFVLLHQLQHCSSLQFAFLPRFFLSFFGHSAKSKLLFTSRPVITTSTMSTINIRASWIEKTSLYFISLLDHVFL